jgi:hypothetical protein
MQPTKIKKVTVLPNFLIAPYTSYGCKQKNFTMWEECGLWMSENEVLKKTLKPETEQKSGNNYITRSLMIFILNLMLLGL